MGGSSWNEGESNGPTEAAVDRGYILVRCCIGPHMLVNACEASLLNTSEASQGILPGSDTHMHANARLSYDRAR